MTPQDEARNLAARLRGIDDIEADIADELAVAPETDADNVRAFVESLLPAARVHLEERPAR